MAETNKNLWAPWRMEYIHSLGSEGGDEACFLCRYWASPQDDQRNRVIWRGRRALAVMTRFPYTNGHLLVSPGEHIGDLGKMDESLLTELACMTRDAVRLLRETVQAHGFNIGMNLERCAGAGLPDHIHTHVVPRWNGDTNYMAVIGEARVISQSLDALHVQLSENAVKLGLTS